MSALWEILKGSLQQPRGRGRKRQLKNSRCHREGKEKESPWVKHHWEVRDIGGVDTAATLCPAVLLAAAGTACLQQTPGEALDGRQLCANSPETLYRQSCHRMTRGAELSVFWEPVEVAAPPVSPGVPQLPTRVLSHLGLFISSLYHLTQPTNTIVFLLNTG